MGMQDMQEALIEAGLDEDEVMAMTFVQLCDVYEALVEDTGE